jgi:drug/metabolite transporter (DMT)-like permease
MARVRAGRRLSHRSRGRRFVKSSSFPRWITVPFVLIIGLILWLGVLSDPSGKLRAPGAGSILYVAAVIAAAGYLAYADRSRDSSGKNRRFR